MHFTWYVLKYSFERRTTVSYNVFDDEVIQNNTEKAIRKYLRAPSKFAYVRFTAPGREDRSEYGFDGLVSEINSIIFNADYSYYDDMFYPDYLDDEEEKPWSVYEQCAPNMIELTHSCIRQYKEQSKKSRLKG